MSPNQRLIAACTDNCVSVWNIETGGCVFEDNSGSSNSDDCSDTAVSNDTVALSTSGILWLWCISTGKQLLHRDVGGESNYGLAISSCGGVVMYVRDDCVEIVDISHLS